MNLMQHILENTLPENNTLGINIRIEDTKKLIKREKIKIRDRYTRLNGLAYFRNCLPLIKGNRDVLIKPDTACKIRVNWKQKTFEGLNTSEILEILKEQWGWSVTVVDSEHTRNKFKNKNIFWVIFDTEKEAEHALAVFNKMFITAIELDAIEEYKRFKENPQKRPLTFDKLINNAYDLYEAVDRGEY